jgi:hypothetical protein
MQNVQPRVFGAFLFMIFALVATSSAIAQTRDGLAVSVANRHAQSSPLWQIPIPPKDQSVREIPLHHPPRPLRPSQKDSIVQTYASAPVLKAPSINILGVGMGFPGYTDRAVPPDPNSAVGDTQFVEWVNLDLAVFDKSTGSSVYGPVPGNTLWQSALPGSLCAAYNSGDPIVQFDKQARRWVLMQPVFFFPFAICLAVSTSSDATGSYNVYEFSVPGSFFPDYPKLGIWPDGYYLSYDQFSGNTFVSAAACAIDRARVLVGSPATMQCFDTTGSSILPSDLDGASGVPGATQAPPTGSPNYFVGLGSASLNVWQFHVDWATPANSTLSGPVSVAGVAPFNEACPGAIACIPAQKGVGLDPMSDRILYRLSYRNFGGYESLLVNHTVDDGAGNIGIRWYEIRTPASPGVFQQGTYIPDLNYRWMGSIAQDKSGNIAVGYSVSSPYMYPAIRAAGRSAADPLGVLGGETSIVEGLGSQTGTYRWGDYTSMAVDPNDDCTFWYTNEYMLGTGGPRAWSTRIASFQFPSCGAPDFAVSASPNSQTINAGGTATYAVSINGINGFSNGVTLSVGGLPPGATAVFSANPTTSTSNLTISTTTSIASGAYSLTITGISAGVVRTTSVDLIVSGFRLAISPNSQSIAIGGTTAFSITVLSFGSFASSVNLSVTGLPSHASANFTPDPTSSTSTLSIKANKNVMSGTYTLTVSGKAGKSTNSAQALLTIQ